MFIILYPLPSSQFYRKGVLGQADILLLNHRCSIIRMCDDNLRIQSVISPIFPIGCSKRRLRIQKYAEQYHCKEKEGEEKEGEEKEREEKEGEEKEGEEKEGISKNKPSTIPSV